MLLFDMLRQYYSSPSIDLLKYNKTLAIWLENTEGTSSIKDRFAISAFVKYKKICCRVPTQFNMH